jgi:hypothetical protein
MDLKFLKFLRNENFNWYNKLFYTFKKIYFIYWQVGISNAFGHLHILNMVQIYILYIHITHITTHLIFE